MYWTNILYNAPLELSVAVAVLRMQVPILLKLNLLLVFTLYLHSQAIVDLITMYPGFQSEFMGCLYFAPVWVMLPLFARFFIGLNSLSSSSDGFPAKPRFYPCVIHHSRLLPKVHRFSYSYLWVGIPVGWKGSIGGMLSSDAPQATPPWYMRLFGLQPGGAWFTVDSDDYIGRGRAKGGLKRKLHGHLRKNVCRLTQFHSRS